MVSGTMCNYTIVLTPCVPYFVSDNDTRFDIDFTVNEAIIPSGAYEFGITNKQLSVRLMTPSCD